MLKDIGVIQVRSDICGDCPTPCANQRNGDFHANACSTCPIRLWGQVGKCDPDAPVAVAPATMRGLGDFVAKLANPIAEIIGLDKNKCGCAARQQRLNELVPFTKALPNGD